MSLRLWHVRWAVPWLTIGLCLGTAAAGVALASWQERMGYALLPLVALLTAAAAAFVMDDTAGDVTRVTARGSRWSAANRLLVAASVALAGLGLAALAPGEVGGMHGWPLVFTALTAVVVAVAAWRGRAHQRTPGSAVASSLVLVGLVPFAAPGLFNGAWPYPSPVLADTARDRWLVLAGVSAIALAWAVLRPLPGPRMRLRTGLRSHVRTGALAEVHTKVPTDARTDARTGNRA